MITLYQSNVPLTKVTLIIMRMMTAFLCTYSMQQMGLDDWWSKSFPLFIIKL